MTRARDPRPAEVATARRDPRLLRAVTEQHDLYWRSKGACQSETSENYFPPPMKSGEAALQVCQSCPVSGACLAWALRIGDCHGVWGGTTARERRAMLVAWRTEEQPEEAPFADDDPDIMIVVAAGDLAVPRSL